MCAAHGGKHGVAMMKVLLDAGADVDKQTESRTTALMLAAENGGEHAAAMVRLLIGAHADVDRLDEDEHTALTFAAQNGCADTMRLLVSCGAIIWPSEELLDNTPPAHAEYIRGAQNWTPLHRAADARDFATLCGPRARAHPRSTRRVGVRSSRTAGRARSRRAPTRTRRSGAA